MRAFDFAPLYRSTVGFDQMASLLDAISKDQSQPAYPPYNIERTGENTYRITMAVAGFAENDLSIEAKQNELTITGKREQTEERNYLYRGIATRSFERKFQLADHVKVASAELENGLLHVELIREIPEDMKPRQIHIRSAETRSREIEGTVEA